MCAFVGVLLEFDKTIFSPNCPFVITRSLTLKNQ